MAESVKVVVPWHNATQLTSFLDAWDVKRNDPRLHLQQDKDKLGCACTKNAGIQSAASDIVIVLDDDCYPHDMTLDQFIAWHVSGLNDAEVARFAPVTEPSSRGTPYLNRRLKMPAAASLGFWVGVGDYDAPGQLVHGPEHPMRFQIEPLFGSYFPLCGMNVAFRPREWWPWCQFINVPRFDDIWMGFLWQREAYRRGHCFRFDGPLVRHVRQSNVWQNLRDEAVHLEANETLWSRIAAHPASDYETLRQLLPV